MPWLSLLGELPAGQVDIAQRGVSVTVPGERGDRVDLPAHPGQVRQAKVPGRVRGEPLDARGQGDPADHLRPGPQAQRLGVVAPRLRQEQRPPCPADRGPVREVLRQQHPGRAPSTARRAPAGSSSSPPGPAACGAPGRHRRCAASTAPRAAARHRRPGRASAGCAPARGGPPPASAATAARPGSTAAWSAAAPGRAALRPPGRRGCNGPAPPGSTRAAPPPSGSRRTAGPAPAAAGSWRSPARPPSRSPPRSRPAGCGRDVSSRTKTATWARFAVTGSTPSLSHISRYSPSPRAYASIVLGARPRSVQICSHVAACSCRPNTGHFSLSTTVPLKPSPKSVVAPREHHHPGGFHVTFKMIKRQMYGRASLPAPPQARPPDQLKHHP